MINLIHKLGKLLNEGGCCNCGCDCGCDGNCDCCDCCDGVASETYTNATKKDYPRGTKCI